MKIALIADPHGNSFALERVRNVLDGESIDRVFCLGDIAVLGPDPRGSVRLIREWADITVLGNTDDWLVRHLDHPEARLLQGRPEGNLARWSLDQLDSEAIDWLASLSLSNSITLPGGYRLTVFHGTPRSNLDVISALTPDDEMLDLVGSDSTFAVGGHTHVQLLKRVSGIAYINPGSAGLPGAGPGTPGLLRNRDVTFAEYAVLTVEKDRYSIELRRLELPLAEMLDWARASGMPHPDWWIARWATS